MTPLVYTLQFFVIVILLVISCFAEYENVENPIKIPVNTLIPCCQRQNSFNNGSCVVQNENTLEFPEWFRNEPIIPLHRGTDYTVHEIQISDLKFTKTGNITSSTQSFHTAEYCVDSISSNSLKLILPKSMRAIPVLQVCCSSDSILIRNGTDEYGCRTVDRAHSIFQYKPMEGTGFSESVYFPKCKHYLSNLRHRTLPNGQVILSGPIVGQEEPSIVWLSLNTSTFCIDQIERDSNFTEVILVCQESLAVELEEIQVLLKTFINETITPNARTIGWVAIASSIFVAFAVGIYLVLWKEHNIHGWTQLSFLVALFLTYFVAGLRRLIGYEVLQTLDLALIFEALEDFFAVSTSANLVALSFDLLCTLRRSCPTQSKREGLRRFAITTALAWSSGLTVMLAGLILNSGQNNELDITDSESLTILMGRLLEFFLCIQNDMLFPMSHSVVQLNLFFLNLMLCLTSAIVLYRKQRRTELAFENFPRSSLVHTWVRRFSKLFLIMGLWWPLSLMCVFDCFSMFNYTVEVWKKILATFYLKPDHIEYEIPWHVHLTSNCLAAQAIIICLVFVWNPKTIVALKRRYQGHDTYILNTSTRNTSTKTILRSTIRRGDQVQEFGIPEPIIKPTMTLSSQTENL